MAKNAQGNRQADQILNSINESVNPCNDFYEFACGRWINSAQIPEYQRSHGKFSIAQNEIVSEMEILLESKEQSTSKAINQIRHYYKLCMDVDRINKLRSKELVNAIKHIGYWPIVHGTLWNSKQFDLTELLISVSDRLNPFFDIAVHDDRRNASRYILCIFLDEPGLDSFYYKSFFRYMNQIGAYRRYMEEKIQLIADDSDAPMTKARLLDDIDKIIQIEHRLATMELTEEERKNTSNSKSFCKLSELEDLVPLIDWKRYFRAVMPTELHDYLDSNPEVNVGDIMLMKKLTQMLKMVKNRDLTNYIIWRYAMTWNLALDARYRDINENFWRILYGVRRKSPRSRICAVTGAEKMPFAASALYIRSSFSKSDKETVTGLLNNIRQEFRASLSENEWMDDKTKSKAIEKLDWMADAVGYPDFITDEQRLDAYYESLDLEHEQTYASVWQRVSVWNRQKSFLKLMEQVERKEFWSSSTHVNAFYVPLRNLIAFPAGILRPPFYDRSLPPLFMFSGIGMHIGHEITHGFDAIGSMFDKEGKLHNWWVNETRDRFYDRATCMLNQANQYETPGTGFRLDPLLTLNEIIADNGGIKVAYKAYRRHVEYMGSEQKRLQGLEQYTNDQLFYLNFAQNFCELHRLDALIEKLKKDPHPPPRFRVNGALSNQPEFATAFKCPANSPMNPTKRCTVW